MSEATTPRITAEISRAPRVPTGLLGRVLGVLERSVRNAAPQDVLILFLDVYLLARVAAAPDTPSRATAAPIAAALAAVALAMVLACRGELLPRGFWRAAVYRLLSVSCFVASYFEMRYVLVALRRPLLDAALVAIDERVLGTTPSVWLERFLTPATAQYFSFFYYSYIWLLALNLVGSAVLDRNGARLQQMLLGGAIVTTLGHVGYTLVPGVGPYAALAFSRAIPEVFFWRRVQEVVGSAGAVLDIFPSLHTAFPTFFALHAVAHRRERPFRHLWPVAVFFAANIVVSTMFLRWHYATDVAAGLLVATAARLGGRWFSRFEARRAAEGRQPSIESLL